MASKQLNQDNETNIEKIQKVLRKTSLKQIKKIKEYNHLLLEKKWQKVWEENKLYEAISVKDAQAKNQKPFYSLIEFPYPSGSGLHVGHIRSNTAMDIISRKRRMEGYNVLYPIGWDAFGLPTENYAIKTGIHPIKVTKKNTDTFRKQLKALGFSFDWSREINTTDSEYYKWTQWIFLQMFNKGLAYKQKTKINWCPTCKIGLANEEVINGTCDRCGGVTTKKEKEQWMLAITKYASRLDLDLDKVDFLEKIKIQQRNWIGKSEGSEIVFNLHGENNNENLGEINVFTTRADTLFGATYVVLAPEHSLIQQLKIHITNKDEVEEYINQVKKKNEIERTAEDKEKTGVELKGVYAINPANEEKIPVWIADYVLASYGTGAVMAVPAHDERDFEFAKNYKLPIKEVITGGDISQRAFTDDGVLINSGNFNGFTSGQARKEITKFVGGKVVTRFKLRDWVFSRQRYWGEPIPLIYCSKCAENMKGRNNAGWIPVPEKDLPVLLPNVKSYKPTDTGESPLASIESWVNTTCPICKGPAIRETDTMPNWAGSSWYFLRYVDPKNSKEFASMSELSYWLKNGVDWYNGGMEHTTLHLLYSRFWHKFLYDLKLVPNSEPYLKRTSHGMILALGGEKMSKSKGNVINPDQIVKNYGADTLRIYEMFLGPFDQAVSWSTESIIGPRRFLEKVWRIGQSVASPEAFAQVLGRGGREPLPDHSQKYTGSALETLLHKTIKKVSEDIESMSFNTAISSMMMLANEMELSINKGSSVTNSASAQSFGVTKDDFIKFLQILAPFAPHITEELYSQLQTIDNSNSSKDKNKKTNSIHLSAWPEWDKDKIVEQSVNIAVQINGKVRTLLIVPQNMTKSEIEKMALEDETIKKWIGDNEIKKIIYVEGRIINIVI